MRSMDIRQPQRKDHPIKVEISDDALMVTVLDGRTITTPLAWYPALLEATPEQRANMRLFYDGISWPDLDVDLSIAGLLSGVVGPARSDEEWSEQFAALGGDPDDILDTSRPLESIESELTSVMTATEVAEAYGITERTVRQSCERGYIPARQSGKTWLIRRRDAEARWRTGEARRRQKHGAAHTTSHQADAKAS